MTTPQAFAPSYGLLDRIEDFEAVCQRLIADAKPFGFDIETSYEGELREKAQLHPEENYPCGFSLTNAFTWSRYAALQHDDSDANLDNYRAAAAAWQLLGTGLGVAHGAKFELRVLARWFLRQLSDHPLFGRQVRESNGYYPIRSCTLLESHAEGINPEHGLKPLTFRTFGHRMMEITELFPKMTQKEEKCMRFSTLNPRDPKVLSYVCEDALWALANHYRRYPKVKDTFIYQLEMAVLPVVIEMEDEGLYYDWNYYREACQRAIAFRDRLSTEVSNDLTGLVQAKDPTEPPVRINLNAPAQIAKVLYDKLGMKTRRKSQKTGIGSTDKTALKPLAQQYPVVRKITQWKSLTKLIGTYLSVYEGRYSYAPDGRTHPGHLQHGVPAGRFAVEGPPYQQSPKKYHFELSDGTTFDFNFRDGIASPPGWYFIGFDYAQQEVRVLAGEAGEEALVDAFSRGVDVHKFTASLMFGKRMEDVTDDERAIGKTIGLALGYMMEVDGLAERLGITRDEAQRLFDQFFTIYPKIKGYMERTIAGAKANGFITTRFGRKVMIWGLQSANRHTYAEAERTAGNAPIQGAGTGDYPKIAMVRAYKAIRAAGLQDSVRMVMNMHDALYWYVRDDVPPAKVIRVLQDAVVFPVEGWPPMVAEWQIGRRWGSMREVEITTDGLRMKDQKQQAVVEEDGDPDEEPVTPVRFAGAALGIAAGPPRHPAYAVSDPGGGLAGVPVSGNGSVPAHPQAPETQPRTVIISIDHMPTQAQFSEFARYCGRGTGIHEVLLRMPEGQVLIPQSMASPQWEPQISLALGGAVVTYAAETADTRELAGGLVL